MPIQPYRMTGVALITGAASGIGRATSLAFAHEGVTRLVLADVNISGLEETSQQLKDLDPAIETLVVQTDTSSSASVAAMVAEAVHAFGAIHHCVNCAGVTSSTRARSHELDEAAWDRVVAVNLRGVWLCQRAQITQMLKQPPQDPAAMRPTGAPPERGAVVNISSVLGLLGSARSGSYTAAKHGVLGLSRTDAVAYGPDGIRVNSVCPGIVYTPMMAASLTQGSSYDEKLATVPIARYGRPEEVAQACVFLASARASFVTGEEVCVDGGLVHAL